MAGTNVGPVRANAACRHGGTKRDMTTTGLSPDEASRLETIIKPGRKAWRSARAEKVAFLVDGAEYFRRLEQVLAEAQRSIFIVGWDFNPEIRLRPEDPDAMKLGD